MRKYDTNGNILWTRQFGSGALDQAFGVAVDSNGNSYVAGFTDFVLPGETSAGLEDAFVRKYDTNGNIVWTRQFGTSQSDQAFAVAADSAGAPDVLTDPSVVLGSGVPSGSNLATNLAFAPGSVGILVDAVTTYAAGTREVVRITYSIPANAPIGLYPITFASTPTVQSVSNASGALLLTNYVSGFVQVGSTASGVEVSGRVLTPDGRGLRNAQVTISDSNGNIRTATTSSFGFYRFEGIEAGSTVIVGVMSRRYRFAARVITAVDSVTDVNFTALE